MNLKHFPQYTDYDPLVPVWCVTPNRTGCFHRFFDTSPISPSGRYLAVFQMPFEDLPMIQKEIIEKAAKEVLEGTNIKYLVGTMIEVPRAALTADEIAKEAEFFSFGTNDLTQMTLGFSRDDVGRFVPEYLKKGLLDKDPFQALDQEGVGQLIEMAVKKGKEARPDIKLGICGEHGGEPTSVEFCHRTGLDYVSCSPFRVPIARLAAAQAVLR